MATVCIATAFLGAPAPGQVAVVVAAWLASPRV